MSLVINHNMMAANAARNLTTIYGRLSTSVQRLSSGLRVNSAADDAAGLAIRELMRADIAVINQGVRNASDAISMIQTAEGAMSVIDEKLIRMKELAEQAATGTYTTQQRIIINSEYQAMAAEIDRIANATDFNGVKVLDGSLSELHDGSGMKIHFGTGNDSAEDYYFVTIGDMRATTVTGLQVGGGTEPQLAQFRTTSLDMAATTDTMANTGTFGVQTSTDGTTWTTYGYVTVDANDTLDDVVSKFGSSAGTNTIDLSAASTSNLDTETIVVNGHTFTFTTANATVTANTIGIDGLSAASIAMNVQYAINTWSSVGNASGVYATIDSTSSTTTVNLVDANMGTSTSTISTSAASLSVGGAAFTNATDTVTVSASAVEDPDNEGEYELQLDASGGYVRLVQTDGVVYTASSLAEGGSPTAAAADAAFALNIGAGTYVQDWDSGDTTTEWYSAEISWDGANILTQSAAQLALAQIDNAINAKDTARANLGAIQNRLENTITNLQIQAENLQASESRISDVDVALEMTEFTRNNIMAQAAVAMLAQANSLPQLAMQLLGG